MNKALKLEKAPHIHTPLTVTRIMLDVIISLIPAVIASVFYFGYDALRIIIVSVSVSVITEFLFNFIAKKENTITDLSAVVTGLILALNLSANIPLWQCAAGSVFAILICKSIFGGLGKNIINPVAGARIFMLMAFSSMAKSAFPERLDAVAEATPLVQLTNGESPSLVDLFLGKCGGAIGETCAAALLIGGVYLIARGTIQVHLPIVFIVSIFIFSFFLSGMDFYYAAASVLSGGVFICAFFMLTDYVTSPTTSFGKTVFAVLAALITVVIREWGIYPEGVSFGILIANILTPYIDILTARRVFGGVKR